MKTKLYLLKEKYIRSANRCLFYIYDFPCIALSFLRGLKVPLNDFQRKDPLNLNSFEIKKY